MREIKFRGWDKDNWNDIKQEFDPIMIYFDMLQIRNNFCGEQYIAHLLNEDTPIMQYTGLKDKNGKEVYESDIVKVKHTKYVTPKDKEFGFPEAKEYTRNYAVEFVNTYCSYGIRLRNKSIFFPLKQATIYTHEVEVIGNIYENPELLTA